MSVSREEIKEYYSNITVKEKGEMVTNTCACGPECMPAYIQDILKDIPEEVTSRFYGCGSPLPPALEGCTVLDLGCGHGDLLKTLMAEKNVRGQGIELDPAAVSACVRRGVAVFQDDIYHGLSKFPDHCYDYVILEETIQTLDRPDQVMLDMLRVGRRGFISFPNFAFWQVRLDLAVRGRMPQTGWLPYNWYDTPNIHNLSIQDFLMWAEDEDINIVEGHVLANGEVRELRISDNLDAEEALLLVERHAG